MVIINILICFNIFIDKVFGPAIQEGNFGKQDLFICMTVGVLALNLGLVVHTAQWLYKSCFWHNGLIKLDVIISCNFGPAMLCSFIRRYPGFYTITLLCLLWVVSGIGYLTFLVPHHWNGDCFSVAWMEVFWRYCPKISSLNWTILYWAHCSQFCLFSLIKLQYFFRGKNPFQRRIIQPHMHQNVSQIIHSCIGFYSAVSFSPTFATFQLSIDSLYSNVFHVQS